MEKSNADVMFTGGVPGDSVEDVFTQLSNAVGDRAIAYPDGEHGERNAWILGVSLNVFPKVAGLEKVKSPLPYGHAYKYFNNFKISDGVKEINLDGALPYARDAIASYKVFKRMRDEGKIAEGVRFQSSIPCAHDAICNSFPNVEDWPRMFDAWQRALTQEYRKMLEVIPANELCVQLDFCTELTHIGGALPKSVKWVPYVSVEDTLRKYTSKEYIAPHVVGLPDEVMLGIHICAGTSPIFPVQTLEDIGIPVAIANALTANMGRRIDYFHMPVFADSDADYFEPLKRLDVKGARIFLGLECNDGLEAMENRIDAAHTHLKDFGVAHYCGYFWNKAVLPDLLQTLAKGADHLA